MLDILAKRAGSVESNPFYDFRNFTYYLFTEAFGFESPSPLQYDIADFMQNLPIGKDKIRRGQVQSMRGAGKTYLAVTLGLWFLWMDPDIKVLALSSIDRKAKDFVALSRQLISTAPLLKHLKPKQAKDGDVERDQKDGAIGFDVGTITRPSKELSLQSYPIFGAFTGCHPDVIISDDIETPENALTVGKRAKLMSKAYEYESLINPGGYIVHMGTPQSEDSVYIKLEKSGYPIRRWPSEAPNLANQGACENVSPWILKAVRDGTMQPGDPTYPERFGKDQLMAKQSIYGPSMYALQMLLDTTLADKDRYPLRLRDLIVMDCHPEMAPQRVIWGTVNKVEHIDPQGLPGDCYYGPASRDEKYIAYTASVMFIDPKGRGADAVGYAVVKALNGTLYALDVGQVAAGKGNDGASEAAMTKLAKIAQRWGIKRVAVEKNHGDGMYNKLLAPIMAKINGPTAVEERTSTGQKELRILDVLEPLVAVHGLVVTPQVASNDALMYQYTRLRRERGCLQHDDMIEALAAACAELVDLVQIDAEKQIASRSAKEKDEMIRAFQKGMTHLDFTGTVPKFTQGRTWGSKGTSRWGHRTERSR